MSLHLRTYSITVGSASSRPAYVANVMCSSRSPGTFKKSVSVAHVFLLQFLIVPIYMETVLIIIFITSFIVQLSELPSTGFQKKSVENRA